MSDSILQVRDLTKTYKSGDKSLTVLDHVSFMIQPGVSCAIVGPSGSGKTTLLGLCAGLDRPTSGSVILKNHQLNSLSEDQLATVRNNHVGFVFQSFQLIPTLTAIENVMVPVELRGGSYEEAFERASQLLDGVGLSHRTSHYPTQLSGGEQQRVGIARAFMTQPEILFADEPTGNLDSETSSHVESILFDMNRQQGTTLVVVTHDLDLAQKCSRVIRLKNGKIDSDQQTANQLLNQAQPDTTHG